MCMCICVCVFNYIVIIIITRNKAECYIYFTETRFYAIYFTLIVIALDDFIEMIIYRSDYIE